MTNMDKESLNIASGFGCVQADLREIQMQLQEVNSDEEVEEMQERLNRIREWSENPHEPYF